MKIIESDIDTFEFERAFIIERDGAPCPVAILSGVECCIETKPGPLEDGLAFCQPTRRDLTADWPVSVVIERDARRERLWNMTAEPGIVAAARRFAELLAVDEARPGMAL